MYESSRVLGIRKLVNSYLFVISIARNMRYFKNITVGCIILTLVLTNIFLLTDFVAAEGFSDIRAGLNKTASQVFGNAYISADAPKLTNIIGLLIRGALSLLGVVYLIMLIIGGFMWVGSKGNEEVVTKSKDIILHASVGLCMTLVGYALAAFLIDFLSTAAGLK